MSEQNRKAESGSEPATTEGRTEAQEWLSTREVCSNLGISRRTLQNWVNKEVVSFSQVHTSHGVENRYRKADVEGLRRYTPATSQAIMGSFTGGEMAGKIFTFLGRLESLEKINDKLDALIAQQENLARTQEILAIEQRRANDLKEFELKRQRLEVQRRGFGERLLNLRGFVEDKVRTQTSESAETQAVESERKEIFSAAQTPVKSANGAATTLAAQPGVSDSITRQRQGTKRFVVQILKLAVRLLEGANR